jgi:hypothetical protein
MKYQVLNWIMQINYMFLQVGILIFMFKKKQKMDLKSLNWQPIVFIIKKLI